ncbi:M6 family metalloprotease domain-containing protein [Carboxydochorda subterranea]|uniref:M6 family metalloprotease domain-containing protein n=1 Tax=Carboxydichorda subterranea TaxID=3109565 RepID=A0ABZ1BZ02_9FIRM|nr:M6 family metalloprotease domain-containing protein [Limnochorda sp. L945t]WRP17963.1 M6 family metalloprotease domain-containing protein [Limnochorda sp. L945t]
MLLIQFSDRPAKYTNSDFTDLLFTPGPSNQLVTGPGSMRDFYEQVSYGAYSVQGQVGGWYTSAQPHDYYGQNDPVYDVDMHAASLVAEAVLAADATIDFSQYDNDGDGYVDVVAIVHQGTGEEEGADPNDIWSHSWNLAAAQRFLGDGPGPITTNDGVIVNDYIIMPELLGVAGQDPYAGMATVGVFTHEYGHAIGLPDLYDTDYSSQGIGNWGLMGGGSWNGINRPGDSPAFMEAWSRLQLGWVTPTVADHSQALTLQPVQSSRQVVRLLNGPEYFLLENRQSEGFDQALPGFGLLIWHIDERMTGNTNDLHRLVDLEEADGRDDLDRTRQNGGNRGDAGDPYPGTSGNTAFTATSYPNNLLYDGTGSGRALTGIALAGNTVTAQLQVSSPPQATVSVTPGWGAPPLQVTFSAAVSDPDGDVAQTWWQLPDGTRVDGLTASTTFTANGVYTATFHAVDAAGNPNEQRVSVLAAPAGTILFVDDDEGQSYEGYFTRAFERAGLAYVTTTPPVHLDPHIRYPIVWNVNDGYPTLTSEDQAFLASYLDAGGRLFLSGQDVLWEIADQSTFDEKYLHVKSRVDDVGTASVSGIEGDPISSGMNIVLAYPFADWSDSIEVASEASGIFRNEHGAFNALRFAGGYRVVFLAFPFEAVPLDGPEPNNAPTLVARVYRYLVGQGTPPSTPKIPARYGAVNVPVQLDGSKASDPDGDPITYRWSLVSLPAGSTTQLRNATSPVVQFTPDKRGDYVVRLTVSDWTGASSTEVTVKVVEAYAAPNPAREATRFYYDTALDGGTLNIYNVAGRLVRSLKLNASGQVPWDLTDATGRPVASGLYLWVLLDKSGKPVLAKPERLVIQR